jgi:large subunit ribosomal protein L5e
MDHLKKENKDKFKTQFGKWDANMTKSKVSSLEALYKKLHADIRKSPDRVKTERKIAPVRKVISKDKALVQEDSKKRKWTTLRRLTKEQRAARVVAKIQAATSKKA